ncbi:AdoMet-dependent rRNA methyltransferase spb1 [Entamoeba marina]
MKGQRADVVLHDGSPNMGKSWIQDAYTQSELCIAALKFAVTFLRKGGWFVSKVFRSQDYYAVLYVFEKFFKTVTATKPPASRNSSAEVYLVCKDFLAPPKYDPNLLDPKFVFVKEEETVVPKLFSNKRPKPQGYDTSKALVYNIGDAKDFIKTDDPKGWLASHTSITFDEALPITESIKNFGEDLKLLSAPELKLLLKWRQFIVKKMKEDKEKEEEVKEEEVEEHIMTEQEELEAELKAEEDEIEEGGMNIGLSTGYDESDQLFSINDIIDDATLQAYLEADPIQLEKEQKEKEEQEALLEQQEKQMELEGMTYDERLEQQFQQDYEQFLEKRNKKKILAQVGEMKKAVYVKESLNDEDELRQSKQKPTKEKLMEVPEVVQQKGMFVTSMDSGKESLWWSGSGMKEIETQMGILQQVLSDKDTLPKEKEIKKEVIDTDYSEEEEEVNENYNDDDGNDVVDSADEENDDDESESDEESEEPNEEEWGPHLGKEQLSKRLIIAKRIVKIPKKKKKLIEQSINRYNTPSDENTPIWLKLEEEQHSRINLPETKEEIREMRMRFREINNRPIKKALEAEARKKRKLSLRLKSLEEKATKIDGEGEMNSREQLRSLQRKALKLTKKFSTKRGVSFVKAGSGQKIGGSAGRTKFVDPRMKKELRAKRRIEKNKTKGKEVRND